MGAEGVCMCILWCACVWVCVCSGFPQSHVWGMCCLCWARGGGGAGRQQSTKERLRQAGRQQAGGLPGRLNPHPRAAQVGWGWAWGCLWAWAVHAATMSLCSAMCSHPLMQAWSPLLPQLLPFPTSRALSSPSSCGSPLTSIHPL